MRIRLLTSAQVLRVVDGDTILVCMQCPCCQTWSNQRVRLARIDAPELRGTARGAALKAKEALASWIDGYAVQLAVTRAWPDKYGRVLAEVIRDGANMSDMMLSAGHAVPWPRPASPADVE